MAPVITAVDTGWFSVADGFEFRKQADVANALNNAFGSLNSALGQVFLDYIVPFNDNSGRFPPGILNEDYVAFHKALSAALKTARNNLSEADKAKLDAMLEYCAKIVNLSEALVPDDYDYDFIETLRDLASYVNTGA